MEFAAWLGTHGFELLQATGIVGGLFSIAYSILDNSRTRRVENLFRITAAHRNIWSVLYEKPELSRILAPAVDPMRNPPTPDERLLIRFLTFHLASVFRATEANEMFIIDGLRADIRDFFSKPLPAVVWEELSVFQSPDFVAFVESCRIGEDLDKQQASAARRDSSARWTPRRFFTATQSQASRRVSH
jgi:hypothetical protein